MFSQHKSFSQCTEKVDEDFDIQLVKYFLKQTNMYETFYNIYYFIPKKLLNSRKMLVLNTTCSYMLLLQASMEIQFS